MTVRDSLKTIATAALTVAGLTLAAVTLGAAQVQQPPARRPPAQRGGLLGAPMLGGGQGLAALRWGLGQLNLTEEQKQQVKTILQDHRQEWRGFAVQVRQARLSLADAIAAGADEGAIRARAGDVAKVQADAAVFAAQVRKDLLEVLTPEQQAKAKELRMRALDRRERQMQRR